MEDNAEVQYDPARLIEDSNSEVEDIDIEN